jgi:ribonuclease HI
MSQLTTAGTSGIGANTTDDVNWTDLLYLCDSETTLSKVSRWIGRGLRTTLGSHANADIMKTILECIRARVIRGARSFIVKIKAHRGDPLNEEADTVAERAVQERDKCQKITSDGLRVPQDCCMNGPTKE